MKVTYLGTTTLLFDDGMTQILFDCHITRPSPFQCMFGKIQTDTVMADTIIHDFKINRLKAIFISHSHHDHVMDAPYFSNKTGAMIYGSKSTLNVARGGKVKEDHLVEFDTKQIYKIDDFSIQVLPSIHSKAKWYNNDLGQSIDKPLKMPSRRKDYKEGGSYDFLITWHHKTYLIRPSFNYLEGELDHVHADVLFLGIAGLAKASQEIEEKFYQEVIEKVHPHLIIPIHYDYFFRPLNKYVEGMPSLFENTNLSMFRLTKYCMHHHYYFIVQLPLTCVDFSQVD